MFAGADLDANPHYRGKMLFDVLFRNGYQSIGVNMRRRQFQANPRAGKLSFARRCT
jgi:hypothetical protein